MIKRYLAIIYLAIFLIALVSGVCQAKEPVTEQRVDDVVTKMMEERHIPGLGIAISMPSGKIITKSYGLSNLEYNIPVENNSIFEVGSLTKTFTAIGILMLQEQGKLSVHDRITKYFPQYPAWNEVTIKHLLQHTSGIKEVTDVKPFKSNQGKAWTPQEVVPIIAEKPLDFAPGQKGQYSNTGCIIFGVVIEKTTGISYRDFLARNILKPLGMTNTMLGSNSLIVPKRVSGYDYTGIITNAEYASLTLPYASGAIISTASDIVKLARVFRGEALISKKSVKEMFAPARLNDGTEYISPGKGLRITYGYGLDEIVKGTKIIPAKTGGISGFNAFFAYYPETLTMVALTANLSNSLEALIIIVDALFGLREDKTTP